MRYPLPDHVSAVPALKGNATVSPAEAQFQVAGSTATACRPLPHQRTLARGGIDRRLLAVHCSLNIPPQRQATGRGHGVPRIASRTAQRSQPVSEAIE
jgi:hypothetical protein